MTAADASVRVLVCDGSADYAQSFARFLGMAGDLEIVGVCTTGEQAVGAVARLSPDLVTIDLDLRGAGAIRAIEEIARARPVPIVIVSDGAGRGCERTRQGLAAGAVEALSKSLIAVDDPAAPPAVALRHRLRRLARGGADRRSPDGRMRVPPAVVGICASAGGPAALEVLLGQLPADFPLPVLVVQHITAGFLEGLVLRLDHQVALPVAIARDGQPAKAGIWFPPDDAHLVLEPTMHLRLDRETVVGPHRPSGDVLLESIATTAGAAAVGVVLTGMGRDGARGADAILCKGGSVIAQDEATSAVFGMPRAAAEAGADPVLPLPRIAGALRDLALVGAKA
jgi:two-component system chemotaxis response regulator CheB